MTFDEAFDTLLGHEGGYSAHPADPGGETMWGVTARVARADGYTGAMRDLPRDRAKTIYRRLYWDAVKADQLPTRLRYPVFDAAVNSGPTQAIKWLQAQIGAQVDGVIGPQTLYAARDSDESAVARMIGLRLNAMTDMNNWSSFSRGWSRRVAALLLGLR